MGKIEENKLQELAMEWKRIAETGFIECKELLEYGFCGQAGEKYRMELEQFIEEMQQPVIQMQK